MGRGSRLLLPLLTVTLVLLATGAGRIVATSTTTPGPKYAELYQRVGHERFHPAERLVRSFYASDDSSAVLDAAVPESLAGADRRELRAAVDEELARAFAGVQVDTSVVRDVDLVRVSTRSADWCVDPSMRVLLDCQVGVGAMTARVEGAALTSDGAFLSVHDSYAMLEVYIAATPRGYDIEGDFRVDSSDGVPRPIEQPEVMLEAPGGELVPVTAADVISVPPQRGLVLRFYGYSDAGLVDDQVVRWGDVEVHLSLDGVRWFIGLDETVAT